MVNFLYSYYNIRIKLCQFINNIDNVIISTYNTYMERYKFSRFNYYYKRINHIYIYNTKTGFICKLSKKDYLSLKHNELNNDSDLSRLVAAGFLVPVSINELDQLEKNYYKNRCSKEEISITLAPTLNCNFYCAYCYEQKNMAQMQHDDYLHLLNFFKQKITKETKTVNFSWFGGEPMLSKNMMINFINAFKKFCDDLEIKLNIYVITNGYILSRDILDFYSNYLDHLDVCITIDGIERQHNIKRPLAPNKPSFNKIISNIKILNANHIYPTIRINIDKNNISAPKKLVHFLLKNNIKTKRIYLGHIRILTNNCKIKPSNCLSMKKYAKIYAKFKKFLFKKGLSLNNYCFEGPKTLYCKANNFNSFVIDPECNCYRCENLLGSNQHSLKKCFTKNENNIYDNWSPFKIDKCKQCILLPCCYGSCAHMYFNSDNAIQCPYFKYTFKKDIKLLIKQFN